MGEPNSLGQRIRERRTVLRLSQAEFASRAGVTQSAVSQWELGTTDLSVGSLMLAAAALDTTPGDLLDGPNHHVERRLDHSRLVAALTALGDAGQSYESLSPSQKAKLVAHLYYRGCPAARSELIELITLVA